MSSSTIMMGSSSSSSPPPTVLPSPIRKSVSASCLLPPKYSCSSSNNTSTETDTTTGPSSPPPRKILYSRSLSTGSSTMGKDNNSTMMTATTTGVVMKRSLSSAVTIVHREKLPTYSSERFYLLSEIEMLAQPTIFLSSLNGGHEHESATDETDEISTLDDDHTMEEQHEKHNNVTIATTNTDAQESKNKATTEDSNTNTESNSDNNNIIGNAFPPYVLLYILWGGRHMTNDPKEFADTYIQYAIDQIENYVTVADASTRYAQSVASENGSVNSVQQQKQDGEVATDSSKPQVNLYLLIERVRPSSMDDDDNNNDNENDEDPMQQELELAESLARYVAASSLSSPRHQQQQQGLSFDDNGSSTSSNSNGSNDSKSTSNWRRIIQGITIGVSNHVRAAPALDAAVSAISYGAADRRRYCTNNNNNNGAVTSSNIKHIDRSQIGVVTMDPSELLGVESDGSTDAAQGIYQSKIVAEWNGNGNLQSFAMRAHSEWKSAVSYIDDPSSSLYFYDENGNRVAQPNNKKALTPAKRRVPRINNRLTSSSSYSYQQQNQHLYGNSNSTRLRTASYTNTTGGYRNYYDRYDNPGPSFVPDDVVDFTVYCLLLCYILYHFYNDVVSMILSIVFGI